LSPAGGKTPANGAVKNPLFPCETEGIARYETARSTIVVR